MSRRSTRLQGKAIKEDAGPPSAASSEFEEPTRKSTTTKPARKKQKTATKQPKDNATSEPSQTLPKVPEIWARTRGRRGHLKMVVEMPFDILLEIFQYLTLSDLLNLSKANHAFRDLLLDRSTALHLWKEAFARVADPKPPPCPEDMSLPQYANLLFGRTCFFCNTVHGLKRDWFSYIRYCKTCLLGNNFVTARSAAAGTIEYHLNRMVALHYDKDTGLSRAIRSDYERHRGELERVQKDKEQYNEYVRKATEKFTARQTRAHEFRSWEYLLSLQKHSDIKERRGTRREAIVAKLREMGYDGLMDRLGTWQVMRLPGMTGVKPLTDKEWEKLRPGVVAALDEKQTVYDQRDRYSLVFSRTSAIHLPLAYYFSHNRHLERHAPRAGQIAKLEPFRTIIYDTPAEQKVQQSDIMKHLDSLPQALEAWREKTEGFLLGLIPSTQITAPRQKKGKGSSKGKGKEIVHDASALKLATTIFDCKWCGSLLLYPHVLDHRCLYRRHMPCSAKGFIAKKGARRRNDPDYQIEYHNEEDRADSNVAWNEGGQQLRFHVEASKYAAAIIVALDEDPSTVTWEELDKANQRIECLRCQRPKASAHKRLVMDWRQAIMHELNADNFKECKEHTTTLRKFTYATAWKKLDEKSLENAYKREPSTPDSHEAPRTSRRLACVECGLRTLNEDGTVAVPQTHLVVHVSAKDTQCRNGHDLLKGTYILDDNSESFTSHPLPVKIP